MPFGYAGGWVRGKVFVCAHVCGDVCVCERGGMGIEGRIQFLVLCSKFVVSLFISIIVVNVYGP